MTPFFIKTFKKDHKCPACPAKKQGARSLCAYHLRLARERFANWAAERRDLARCIRCDRKSFNGWLRCRIHTKENRTKCLSWIKRHPESTKKAWQKRINNYIAYGLCPYCKDHRPAVKGFKNCQPCRDRSQNYYRAVSARSKKQSSSRNGESKGVTP